MTTRLGPVVALGKRMHSAVEGGVQLRVAAAYRELLWQGRFDEAFEVGERLMARSPCAEAYEVLACPVDREVPSGVGLYDLFAQLEREPSSRHPAWRVHVRVLLLDRLEWGEQALQASAALTSQPSRYGWMRFNRGALLRNLGAYDEAIAEYRASLAAAPRFWKAAACAAECVLCEGDAAQSFAELDACAAPLEAHGDTEDLRGLRVWRSALLLWTGHYEEALRGLDEAADVGHSLALGWRGAARLLLGRADEAAPDLDRALALNENDVEARIWRAEAYAARGDIRRALVDLDQAMSSGWVWASVDRAIVRADGGDIAGARADLARVPARILRAFEWQLGVTPREPSEQIALLKQVRSAARGLRRPETYLFPLWVPLPTRK